MTEINAYNCDYCGKIYNSSKTCKANVDIQEKGFQQECTLYFKRKEACAEGKMSTDLLDCRTETSWQSFLRNSLSAL